MLQPFVRHWCVKGIRITLYLDDGLAVTLGKQQASEASPKKSQWEPVERLNWLGFVIDMSVGQIEEPEEKPLALRELTRKIMCMPEIPASLLACVVGKIISLGLAIGPVSRFMPRSLYDVLETRAAWCDKLVLPPEAHFGIAALQNTMHNQSDHPLSE